MVLCNFPPYSRGPASAASRVLNQQNITCQSGTEVLRCSTYSSLLNELLGIDQMVCNVCGQSVLLGSRQHFTVEVTCLGEVVFIRRIVPGKRNSSFSFELEYGFAREKEIFLLIQKKYKV